MPIKQSWKYKYTQQGLNRHRKCFEHLAWEPCFGINSQPLSRFPYFLLCLPLCLPPLTRGVVLQGRWLLLGSVGRVEARGPRGQPNHSLMLMFRAGQSRLVEVPLAGRGALQAHSGPALILHRLLLPLPLSFLRGLLFAESSSWGDLSVLDSGTNPFSRDHRSSAHCPPPGLRLRRHRAKSLPGAPGERPPPPPGPKNPSGQGCRSLPRKGARKARREVMLPRGGDLYWVVTHLLGACSLSSGWCCGDPWINPESVLGKGSQSLPRSGDTPLSADFSLRSIAQGSRAARGRLELCLCY